MSCSANTHSHAHSAVILVSTTINQMGSGSLPEDLIYNSAPDESAANEATSFEMPMNNESDGRRNR